MTAKVGNNPQQLVLYPTRSPDMYLRTLSTMTMIHSRTAPNCLLPNFLSINNQATLRTKNSMATSVKARTGWTASGGVIGRHCDVGLHTTYVGEDQVCKHELEGQYQLRITHMLSPEHKQWRAGL